MESVLIQLLTLWKQITVQVMTVMTARTQGGWNENRRGFASTSKETWNRIRGCKKVIQSSESSPIFSEVLVYSSRSLSRRNKHMITILENSNQMILHCKGASEVVLKVP